MIDSDFDQFQDAWLTAHELSVSNQQPSVNAVNKAFDLLMQYPLQAVQKAIDVHGKRSKFPPTPADIVSLLETNHKHLSADEAWALCPKTEFETVVWTDEMAEAYGSCYDLLAEGDKIGARMAFKGAYERLVNVAELKGKRPQWRISIGSDKTMIESAVRHAVSLGRINPQQAQKYLPHSQDGGVIGKLLTGKVIDIKTKKELDNVRKLKEIIVNAGKSQPDDEKPGADSKQTEFEKNRQDAIRFCEQQATREV